MNINYAIRQRLIETAEDLLDQSPGEDEYVRGMTELIARSTLSESDDADTVRSLVEAQLQRANERAKR